MLRVKIAAFTRSTYFLILLAISCGTPEKNKAPKHQRDSESITTEYAKRFEIVKKNDRTYVYVNADSIQPSYTYLLVPKNSGIKASPGEVLIVPPVDRLVVTSTSHIAFLDIINGINQVIGFPNTSYISSDQAKTRIDQGFIMDIGTSNGINFESLIELRPELVVHYISGPDRSELKRLDQSGIPYVLNLDFLEETPLGRAEWVKFMGLLIGKEKQADSVFNMIKDHYNKMLNLTGSITHTPEVFSGVLYGDTWFAPGANSFVAKLIQDAGGKYTWMDHNTSGSIELSFETVLERNINSEFWIGVGGYTSSQALLAADSRYSEFSALQNGNTYNYHRKIGAGGGFEYFELGGVRPDLVLADLIKILHPDLVGDHKFVFFKKLD